MCMHMDPAYLNAIRTAAGDPEITALMAWDVLSTTLFTLLTSGILTYVVADHPFEWFTNLVAGTYARDERKEVKLEMFMVSLYTTLLSLFAIPWVAFAIPGVGALLHQMRPTGFDEAGGLKLEMTLQQMKRKQKRLMHANLLSVEEAELLYAHMQALPEMGLTLRARARTTARNALGRGAAAYSLHMLMHTHSPCAHMHMIHYAGVFVRSCMYTHTLKII